MTVLTEGRFEGMVGRGAMWRPGLPSSETDFSLPGGEFSARNNVSECRLEIYDGHDKP